MAFALQLISVERVCIPYFEPFVLYLNFGLIEMVKKQHLDFVHSKLFFSASYICTNMIVFWLNYAKMFCPWKQSMRVLHENCAINYLEITFDYYPEGSVMNWLVFKIESNFPVLIRWNVCL